MSLQKATFGAGCFWGVEAEFRQLPKGVVSTAVGYEGGTMKNPTYRDVCTDRTGHAEVVEVEYDPEKVSYEDLLKVFWAPRRQRRGALFFDGRGVVARGQQRLSHQSIFFGKTLTIGTADHSAC